MKIPTSKIVLGGAQLGLKYGITNRQKKMPMSEVKKIFLKAKNEKIKLIDTAFSYGNFEKIFFRQKLKTFELINKIEFDNHLNDKKLNLIKNKILSSLKKLKKKDYYALLIHNSETLDKENYKKAINFLELLKKNKLTKKIGISIYEPLKIKKFFKIAKFDLVQFPYNFFDRRIEKNNILDFMKKNNIESHARSIFLQGVLLLKSKFLPKKLSKYQKKFNEYIRFLDRNNINQIQACLTLTKSRKIDKFVLGFQSQNELNSILKTKFEKLKTLKNVPKTNSDLINPHKW
jgi:aryl-alcohol dehydrogenase-like predicted oxidoreductase